jgi:cobalt/nickel transport system ATP-binding protein
MCFYVMKDEIVALCGPNGAGKSTLIEHLNGLLIPSEGDIWINGRSLARGERTDLWKEVGVVFQRSEDQLFAPTVLDDVMFGPLNLGLSPEEAKAAAMKALEAVGTADLIHKLPNYLSGGQKRLVSIAGILAMKPQIIALDEPTSDLDPVHCGMIERLIVGLKEQFGISVVIATHDLEFAARIADRVCLVRNGAVFAEGSPREVFYDTALIEEAGLKLPDTVMTWLEYCRGMGLDPAYRPIMRTELVALLERIAGDAGRKNLD